MRVVDPDRTDFVSTEGLRVPYQLTAVETDVCRMMAEGLGNDKIADTRNLTRESTRTYIKRILQKTGTGKRDPGSPASHKPPSEDLHQK